jgi:acetoin utilization deacetylase AcuC-like enzyme
MMKQIGLIDDPIFDEHVAPGPHPERPERLDFARRGVRAATRDCDVVMFQARDANDQELARVHREAYIEELGRVAGLSGYFDADTFYCARSVAAARRAAGGAIVLVDALLERRVSAGVALLRPPGHHALPSSAMGFCLLNNVAVAAAHARAKGARRVLILDWDVHHGNGTQDMFYADPTVLYVSLHQFPFYPGTGAAGEVGSGDGEGYTVNVPLTAEAGDAEYASAFDRVVCPIAASYDADLVLISAGFDAHRRDPLAMMQLSADGYALMTTKLLAALPRRETTGIGIVLEGGYDLVGLSESLASTVLALASDRPIVEPVGMLDPTHERDLERAERALEPFWRLG